MTNADFPPRRSWRRIITFVCTFALACVLSLTYVYTRPAEYRAVARLHISPAGSVAEEGDATRGPVVQDNSKSFLTEVQILTSRPLLENAMQRLRSDGTVPDLGQDPINAVQQMLEVEPVEGTQIVQLSATGPQRRFVSDLVNAVATSYRQRVVDTYKSRTTDTYSDVSAEADALQQQIAAKQKSLDAFRDRYDIVSLERTENQVLANIEGLARSYADSSQRLAKAQGNLQALQNSLRAGKAVVRAKDDPTLGNLEQRASTLREQLRELQRRFTPKYLALDVDALALQARIADLEEQLKTQHVVSEQAAISEAQEELASAEAEAARLRKNLDENRIAAQGFAARLAQFKTMQSDLDHLQGMERTVQDRLTKLKASESERAPRVEIVETAAPSLTPWRPDYTQDAAISIVGSVLLGLFAVWSVEFISGAPPQRAVVHHSLVQPALERFASLRTLPLPNARNVPQLSPPAPPLRELADSELTELISNGSDDLRLVVLALLAGMSPAEIVGLCWSDIDFESATIKVGGESPRSLPLQEALARVLRDWHAMPGDAAVPVLSDDKGNPLTREELDRIVLFAAYDAGLEHPQEITTAALRYTYLIYLLRQGIRANDISRIAGHIPQEDIVSYIRQISPGARRALGEIDRIHPALRSLPHDA